MATQQMPMIRTTPELLANETVCYPMNMVTTNGIWVKEDPLNFALPLFLLQTMIIVLTTRLLMFLLKPFHQPRVFCEFIAGIILGPSVMGQIPGFSKAFFSKQGVILFETIANMGAIYFVFILGLEMDLSVFRKLGKKALVFAGAGIFLPLLTGFALSYSLFKNTQMLFVTFSIFFSISVSATSFPALERILGELRLLETEIGKLAKLAALINDTVGMALLVFAVSYAETKDTAYLTSVWVILASIVFVVFCILVIRPAIAWLIKRTPEDENFSDLTTSIILAGVMFSGVITDAIGVYPIFGAFVFGLVVPNGQLSVTIIEKLEDFVRGILLPLFFVTSGLKTNVSKIKGATTWAILISSIVLSFAGKLAGTILPALLFKMPFREGAALGLLMNTKGLIALIALNFGKDQKFIDDTAYAMMVIVAISMNAVITPLVVSIYKPARKFVPYKRRTIQKTKASAELRILACIHTPRNVPTIINLLEASHPTKKSPISIFSLHLVELTGHASATLIVHGSQKSDESELVGLNRSMQAQSDNIINAFETFAGQQQTTASGCVSVQSFTAISPYSVMHEEICNLAEDRRVAFIVLPFHKQQMVDGGMETANPKFRMVNQNVMANAPCSVGILVDRGLNGSTRSQVASVSQSIALLFFGGPDDREALSYAVRMSENPGTSLTVTRFLPGPDAIEPSTLMMEQDSHHTTRGHGDHSLEDRHHGILTLEIDTEREKQIDDDYIKEFRLMKANDESFSYVEKVVNNGEETVAAIRSVDTNYDLFMVGRGEGMISPLTAGLTEWSECPELGVIGDLLASADFAATVSVLVVQQYVGLSIQDEGVGTPDSASQQEEQYIMDSIRR